MPEPETARAHVRLGGRVQGVGFRISTAEEARRRGLKGWVRNLDSGGVEAVFEGPEKVVADMVRWCNDGPPGSFVSDLKIAWDEPPEDFHSFEVRPTSDR
jgi:acylphosphatase